MSKSCSPITRGDEDSDCSVDESASCETFNWVALDIEKDVNCALFPKLEWEDRRWGGLVWVWRWCCGGDGGRGGRWWWVQRRPWWEGVGSSEVAVLGINRVAACDVIWLWGVGFGVDGGDWVWNMRLRLLVRNWWLCDWRLRCGYLRHKLLILTRGGMWMGHCTHRIDAFGEVKWMNTWCCVWVNAFEMIL